MAPGTLTMTLLREQDRDFLELPTVIATVRSPGAKPREVRLSVGTLTVGSGADCGLICDDPSVSRHHCELQLTNQGIRVRDLDSKNGTRLGQALLQVATVSPGCQLELGGSTLTLRLKRGLFRVPLSDVGSFGAAFGTSTVMRALFAQLERAAPTDSSILLLGESGTGKEVLARAVHERSARRKGPFVVLDCACVSAGLIEAELFGHVAGAFTGAHADAVGLFEQAHGGTLFLDELGELPLELQPRLLRALEEGQIRPVGSQQSRAVDVRVVAATHRDLPSQLEGGEFRKDLYFRVAVVEVEVPPLRGRKEDIPALVRHFLAHNVPPVTLEELPPNTLSLLTSHHWPGNVRELRNTCTRLALFGAADALMGGRQKPKSAVATDFTHLSWSEARGEVMIQFERDYLESVLRTHGGNVSAAARAIGISRQLAHRLITRHGLKAGEPRATRELPPPSDT